MKEEVNICPCLMKRDMEQTVNVLDFIEENYSLEGFMEQLPQLSAKDLKCAYCLLEVARRRIEAKEIYYDLGGVERLMIAHSAVAEKYILSETVSGVKKKGLKDRLKKLIPRFHN